MIATERELAVRSRADYELLPDDGRWEVVEGRAISLPPPSIEHQDLVFALQVAFAAQLRLTRSGHVSSGVGVFIPPPAPWAVQARVPDLIVYSRRPPERFELGNPPELVIEVLSTPRGNVERTEKLDDYARAGIAEYWIVDPFARLVEVYRLAGADYELAAKTPTPSPVAFPEVTVDMGQIWDEQ